MRGVAVVVCLVVAGCATFAPTPPSPPRQAKLGLTIRSLSISDGLRVVLVQDPHASEVSVTMRYQVGGVDDPADQAGIAHLVEHLMFQQAVGAQSIFARLEQDATYFNAETTLDATTYVARATRTTSTSCSRSTRSASAFAAPRSPTRPSCASARSWSNEIRQSDAASALLAALHAGLYPDGHPYRREVGGTPERLATLTRDQACAFADAHYAPGNAVLVVSGDLTVEQLQTSLAKAFGHTPRRAAVPPAIVPSVPEAPHSAKIAAPSDDPALVIAWPLPADRTLRARMRAVAPAARFEIDNRITGQVALIELGDARAPMIALIVVPGPGESIESVRDSVRTALGDVAQSLELEGLLKVGELMFDRLQQTAIYELFASLESAEHRDAKLAELVLAGLEPGAALDGEFKALRTLTRDDAIAIARDRFTFAKATVVELFPDGAKKRGHAVDVATAIHDHGQRRDPPDPAVARQPMAADLAARGLRGIRTRTLPNGMKVVLMPLTSVPAIDVRIVFGVGTGDEPANQRGLAELAAHGLTWDLRYLNDMLLFAGSGGFDRVDVGRDYTAFVAQGLDMHVDLLLAGLRRIVRDGIYGGSANAIASTLSQTRRSGDDGGKLTDAWRTALFGASHPYVCAGRVHCGGGVVTPEDAPQFRGEHYTPDNATLVIAGQFDAALADRWIDYLFGDWTGHAMDRESPRAQPSAASLARAEDTSQIYLEMSLPVDGAHRAEHLIAADMLDAIVGDVRHQLGATYGLHAMLAEWRLASSIEISGWVEAGRAREAIELIRARVAALHADADADATASAFVSARERVEHHAASVTGSAESLADRVVHDVELGQAAPSELHTAVAVAGLTIADMTATFGELDLAKAAVLIRGPRADVDAAFGALGRTPTYIEPDPVRGDREAPATASASAGSHGSEWSSRDISEALTSQPVPTRLATLLASGYTTGSATNADVTGLVVHGEVGWYTEHYRIGLHASIGHLDGTYNVGDIVPILKPAEVLPLEASLVLTTGTDSRFWGGIRAGVHAERIREVMTTWETSFAVGLEGGVDAYVHGLHRLGFYGGLVTEIPDGNFTTFTIGVAYRR